VDYSEVSGTARYQKPILVCSAKYVLKFSGKRYNCAQFLLNFPKSLPNERLNSFI
jgi:hypothetical protein